VASLPIATANHIAVDGKGNAFVVDKATPNNKVWKITPRTDTWVTEDSTVGLTVPTTLALTLGPNPSFGAFTPGIAADLTATTSANVISTAGDASLTVSDPGHLTNGSFALAEPLLVQFSKSTWTQPVTNDPVTITFEQHINASDVVRAGTYTKKLTFTLSTSTP
jgi:hypothetical protein